MTPIPEPTIYDITDIPFFAWDPPSLAWIIVIAFAVLTLLTLFSPFRSLKKNTKPPSSPFSAKLDAISQIEEAISTLSEESISKASMRIKRLIEEKEHTELSTVLNQLNKARYAPDSADKVKELLITIKKEISRAEA